MSKIHVTPDGPKRCNADPTNPRSTGCIFDHFDTLEEAQASYEQKLEAEYGSFSTVMSKETSPETAEKDVAYYQILLENSENPFSPENDDYRNGLYQAQRLLVTDESTVSNTGLVENMKEPDGGATLNVNSRTYISSGFAYSPYPEHSQAIHVSDITEQDVEKYLLEKSDILSQEGHNLGVWHDPETNMVYLDISVVSDDAKVARQGCKDNDQIAFFDMQTFDSVEVDRMATSGGQSLKV